MSKTRKKWSSKARFALIIIISAIAGGIGGVLLMNGGSFIEKNAALLFEYLGRVLLPIWSVFWLVMTFTALFLYEKAKKQMLAYAQNLDAEGEDEGSKILSVAMLLNSINMILSFGIYGITFGMQDIMNSWLMIWALGLFIVNLAFCVSFEVRSVSLTKRCQPEKQGDPLELRFEKDWMSSCDEAEKAMIHAAAYQTFQLLRIVIIGLWLVSALGAMYLHMGVVPVIFITIVWLFHTVGYLVYVMKAEKKHNPGCEV